MENNRVYVKDYFGTVFYIDFPIIAGVKNQSPLNWSKEDFFLVSTRRVIQLSPFPVSSFNGGESKAFGNSIGLQ